MSDLPNQAKPIKESSEQSEVAVDSIDRQTAESNVGLGNSLSDHDMPVTLRFEAGTFTLPMAELAKIPEGYVFELEKPLDRQVIKIFANDRAVACGELVLIGDAVGVRVTAIYPRATDLRA